MSFIDKILGLFKKEGSISNDRRVIEEGLDDEQKIINDLYARDGLTDEVLERQVKLNSRRNELDIPDKEFLNDNGWSQ